MTSRKDMQELMCELTDEEVLDRARAGATASEELLRLQKAKAEWMTAHKAEVEEQQGTAARMNTCVRTGRERRLIECVIEFHVPMQGKKRTTRMDTGEMVNESPMSLAEMQENLFDAPPNPAGLAIVPPQEESRQADAPGYTNEGQE